jgi:diguanylate cyclase (GGDEF)-like protein
MNQIRPLTLSFRDNTLERKFFDVSLKHTRRQGQVAIFVGMFVYVLQGILDQWFVAPELIDKVWMIRLTALCVPTFVLMLMFTPWFARLCHPVLAIVGLAAGMGMIAVQVLLPFECSAYYYPMMVLVTFYTYNFIGTRFIYALCIDLFLLIVYNVIFGWLLDWPPHILISHDFFIVSANMVGGSTGYLVERQRRVLYLRELELDNEGQRHLIRSLHDPLTGLPNRDLLYDRIEQAKAEAQREGTIHCGFYLDLDGFKAINDKLTHATGDCVLREVSQRLTLALRGTDTVARIGGDEFFILAMNIDSEEKACDLAEKLLTQFNIPFPGVPDYMRLGVSIGMCLWPYEGMTGSDLIHRADEAMYQVKSSGKGYFAFSGMQHKKLA